MIPHNAPCLGREEEEAAIRVLRSGWVAQGPEVEQFEQEIAGFLGLEPENVAAVSSGSSALFLSLKAIDAQGKGVSLPAYGCRALKDATDLAGAAPLWADTAQGRPNVDPTQLGGEIAVIAHMFGLPAAFPEITDHLIVEDCCQSLGARVGGHPLGNRGAVAVYSFGATKLMTTGGQGGLVASRDRSLVDAVRVMRDYDGPMDGPLRFNFQMTDLQAAVGRAQLAKLPAFLERREVIFQRYKEAGLPLLESNLMDVQPVRFRAVTVSSQAQKWNKLFNEAGVRTIIPVTHEELPENQEALPNAYAFADQSVSLPIFPGMSDAEVETVVAVAQRVMAQ